jgi:hypothetical protein
VADIFQEVDEDVRREQMIKWWKRYGNYVVAAAVVVALVIGGLFYWQRQREERRQISGAQFHAAQSLLRQGKPAEAAKAFEDVALDGDSGYRALAGLQRAAALTAAKDADGAVAAYDAVAKDTSIDQTWRDLAALLAVLQVVDKEAYPAIERRLSALTAEANPWRHLARELLGAAKLKAGDLEGARQTLQQIADDATAPAGVRGRAAEALAALGPKAG